MKVTELVKNVHDIVHKALGTVVSRDNTLAINYKIMEAVEAYIKRQPMGWEMPHITAKTTRHDGTLILVGGNMSGMIITEWVYQTISEAV